VEGEGRGFFLIILLIHSNQNIKRKNKRTCPKIKKKKGREERFNRAGELRVEKGGGYCRGRGQDPHPSGWNLYQQKTVEKEKEKEGGEDDSIHLFICNAFGKNKEEKRAKYGIK